MIWPDCHVLSSRDLSFSPSAPMIRGQKVRSRRIPYCSGCHPQEANRLGCRPQPNRLRFQTATACDLSGTLFQKWVRIGRSGRDGWQGRGRNDSGAIAPDENAVQAPDPGRSNGKPFMRQCTRYVITWSGGGTCWREDGRIPRPGVTPCWLRSPRSCPRTRTSAALRRRHPPNPGCGWRCGRGTSGRG